MSISQRKYFVLLHDPSEYPLQRGMRFDNENLEAMLSKGTFTPGTILEQDGQRFAVHIRTKHQGSKFMNQEIRQL